MTPLNNLTGTTILQVSHMKVTTIQIQPFEKALLNKEPNNITLSRRGSTEFNSVKLKPTVNIL
jgi:hypothetical protein